MSLMWNIRWGGATALAAMLMARDTAAADRAVHELQITASRYAFDPATIQVNAGEPVVTPNPGFQPSSDRLSGTLASGSWELTHKSQFRRRELPDAAGRRIGQSSSPSF